MCTAREVARFGPLPTKSSGPTGWTGRSRGVELLPGRCRVPPPALRTLPSTDWLAVGGTEYEKSEVAKVVGKRRLSQGRLCIRHRRNVCEPFWREGNAVLLHNAGSLVAAFVIGESLLGVKSGHADVIAIAPLRARMLEPHDIHPMVGSGFHSVCCFGRRHAGLQFGVLWRWQ
jgi:hypothetical protein